MIKKIFLVFLLLLSALIFSQDRAFCASYADFGTVKDSYQSDSGNHTFIISDNRSNLMAQNSIFNILADLCETKEICFIFVPDFFGIIDTAVFTTFPDRLVKRDVSYSLLVQGLISGAEYFAVNSESNHILYGVEQHDFLKSFNNRLELIQMGEDFDLKAYLDRRAAKNAVGFVNNITTKKIQNSAVIIPAVEIPFYQEALKEKDISYTVIVPTEGKQVINLQQASVVGVSESLGRNRPVRMTLFEHEQYRGYFMNTYISLLKALKESHNTVKTDYAIKWKKALSGYIERKKAFFQKFLVLDDKNVDMDEIFSLFGILDTVEDEFLNLQDDIVTHDRVSLYRKEGEKDFDFFMPVSFYNTGKRICYYFYKNIQKRESFLPNQKLFSLGEYSVAIVSPESFLDMVVSSTRLFLGREGDLVETVSRIGSWSFLNVFQKRYLLSLKIVDLKRVLKELMLIVESSQNYDASKQAVFEKQILTIFNALADVFIVNKSDEVFISIPQRAAYLDASLEMEKIIRTFLQLFRMLTPDKGYLDVIIGDIFYKYDNTIKSEYLGKADLDELKSRIKDKTVVLMGKVLSDNDIFGIVDNFSQWIFRRFARGDTVSFGIKQKGSLKIGTNEYILLPGALQYKTDHFTKRMGSYANAVGISLDDLLRKFDFSRIEVADVKNARQLAFIMMTAYIQKSIKDASPYEKMDSNDFKFTNKSNAILMIDVQLFEKGYIGGSWIEYLIASGAKIYLFDTASNDYEAVKEKLKQSGFKDTELDSEIDSLFEWVDGRSKFSSEMLLIENKEDVVAKVVTAVSKSVLKNREGYEVYVYLSKENVNTFLLFSKVADNARYFLVEDGVYVFQCIAEFFSRVKDADLSLLNRRLNYSPYDLKYFANKTDTSLFKREPKTMPLLDMFVLARNNIHASEKTQTKVKKQEKGNRKLNEKK